METLPEITASWSHPQMQVKEMKRKYMTMIQKQRFLLWVKAYLKWTEAKQKNCSAVRQIKI